MNTNNKKDEIRKTLQQNDGFREIGCPYSNHCELFRRTDAIILSDDKLRATTGALISLKDIEILEGNQKKTIQTGSWEFRNDMKYKNSVHNNFIMKLPIIKKSEYLQKLIFKIFFEKSLERDFEYFHHRTLGKIQKYIESSFIK